MIKNSRASFADFPALEVAHQLDGSRYLAMRQGPIMALGLAIVFGKSRTDRIAGRIIAPVALRHSPFHHG